MADDGEALRKRIADLEQQLKSGKGNASDDRLRKQLEKLQYDRALSEAGDYWMQKEAARLNLKAARQQDSLAHLNEQALRDQVRVSAKRQREEPIHDEILDNQLVASRIARAREEARSLDPETFIPDGDAYPWEPGKLYLGRCRNSDKEVGAATNIHALTVGASGYGKGAGTIIQNLLRWPDNALVIDCKNGENAEHTAKQRAEKFDQECFILDPFDIVPNEKIDHPLVSKIRFNPLDDIDLFDDDVMPRIRAVASGIIIRDAEKDEFWQRGAENILCGLIAFVCDDTDMPNTLYSVRQLITRFCDENGRPVESRSRELAQLLADAPNDLCQAASAEINSPQGESYLSGVISSTAWLDDRYMRYSVMDTTKGFHLSALKNRPATIYLSLPINALSDNRVFLRMFVSLALKQIKARSGGRKVLFILDEFSSLGPLKDVETGFSVLRDFNCTVWPMIQNWKQLTDVYGEGGADTILAACQIAEFFSPLDDATPEKVSRKMGVNPETEFPYLTPGQYSELVRMEGDLAHRKIVFMPGKPRFISIRVQGWWNDKRLLAPAKEEVVHEKPIEVKPPSVIEIRLAALHRHIVRDFPHLAAASMDVQTFVEQCQNPMREAILATKEKEGWTPSTSQYLTVFVRGFSQWANESDQAIPTKWILNPERFRNRGQLIWKSLIGGLIVANLIAVILSVLFERVSYALVLLSVAGSGYLLYEGKRKIDSRFGGQSDSYWRGMNWTAQDDQWLGISTVNRID